MSTKTTFEIAAEHARLQQLGIKPSTCTLPPGHWETLLDYLCERFKNIGRDCWLDRFERGLVFNSNQQPLSASTPHRTGLKIFYYREIKNEKKILGKENILYQDEHILVVDKPHFLPVIPAGHFVSQTLLARLIAATGNNDLQPLHRIDRHTAGLVLFSTCKQTRGLYQALFREQQITKSYEALAPALPDIDFPHLRSSRIVRGEPFFLSREVTGVHNAHSRIDVLKKHPDFWHYALQPISGKKHQLRVHMAALGAPILNDPFYPLVDNTNLDNLEKPLQLLACELNFKDPVSGTEKHFHSHITLKP
jgi:tRNA pseudouridine32 synthase/23S rRNA pseudouridine746 synthase